MEGMPTPATEFLAKPPVLVKLGNFHDVKTLLAIGGLFLTVALMAWRVKGAILLGMIATATAGYFTGHADAPTAIVAMPFIGEYDLSPIAFQLDIAGVLTLDFFPLLLTLFVMSFLDTLGTLVGVGAAGGMLDDRGNLPDMHRPMLVDAVSCMASALLGTSTSGAYIESAAGIRDGARTGLAAVTTALLFALTLFFIPLVQPLQQLSYAYGPALIVVGALMFGSVRGIDWDDFTESIPAFITLIMIALSFNIANGLTAGLIVHPLLKFVAGKWRDVSLGAALLAALCLVYYLKGLPH